MDQDQYAGLIDSLEAESQHHPARFQRKVLLLSIAAYVALALLLVLLVAAVTYIARMAATGHSGRLMIHAGFLALMIVPLLYTVLSMFLMRLSPPEGRELTRAEAPKLFDIIDKMRKKLSGPPIHHVLIEREFNASIMQVPKFGLFGGARNYLCLGLPFMASVAPKEMFAVIAHEYGHLCGNHGKFGAWVYRQRRVFAALHEKVEAGAEDSILHSVLAWIMKYFWPHYNAYTFVLSRQQEYEADRTAADLVGAKWMTSGLIRTRLLGRWMGDEYWRKFYLQADAVAKPGFMPYTGMRTAFQVGYEEWATQAKLTASWQEKSGLLDTHPCLRERVEAVGEKPLLPPKVEETAADVIFGSFAKQLNNEFDENWWQDSRNDWEKRYRHASESKRRLSVLSAMPLESLALHDLQEFASLKYEFESLAATVPIVRHLLAQPGGPFPKASYMLGRALLAEKNDAGLEYLFDAARADNGALESVAHIGYDYLFEKKGETAAHAWWKKIGDLYAAA